MKKFSLMIAGLGIAVSAIPAAAFAAPAPAPRYGYDQGWQNINARQARIEARINQGIRSGALSRREATQLRAEFRSLERLEAQYRRSRPGLTMAERRDLDRRFDALSARVMIEKHDRNDRNGHRR
ncbi:hypothetical protein IAG41_20965 [Sphingomonas sp. JC676]|uniref:hypothetical protein n=1 Tax=Sphingomonas sp. JC676 TaxID=2768065 RepID=UPI00165828C6|nr:hypothetical protein [Sphingomonas sp. JC676]MBC9034870.1 hypothetical protein [Sphingomonas sp. JC676]